jgi:signal transduction histidine kinase
MDADDSPDIACEHTAALARPRVLVVDDLEDNRIVLGRRLTRRGYEVVEAASGEEALARLLAQAFDLVLLDIVMPGLDGFETLARIRAVHGPAQLPVIMITVRDGAPDVVRALQLGASDYVAKPFDFDVVHARISTQISLKQLLERAGRDQPELEAMVAELRQAVHKAERAAQAKADFLANMSHEIRTPLNGMLGLANVLAAEAGDPSHRDLARVIADSAVSLERLLSDTLDLSRAEAGKLEIRAEPFALAEVVRRVVSLFSKAAAAKGLTVETAIDASAETRVVGDSLRLQQILTNLVSNAVKFTERGFVRVRAAAAPDGSGYRFEVTDSGIGFDPVRAEDLFGRFEQADSSIAGRFGGSGLGLAISRRLAELMGGALTATSTPGEGAVFTLALPLPLAGAPAPAAPALVRVRADGRLWRILVADDHEVNRRVAELMLSALGMQSALVCDGAQALQALETGGFDAVLMDLEMPGMDGLSAIAAIRQGERATGQRRLPVIALSSHTSPVRLARCIEAGADACVTKPVQAEALASALFDLLPAQAEDHETSGQIAPV